jgi:hypothetical protein
MSEIECICDNCKWEDETPPSPEEWEKLKADSKRLDKLDSINNPEDQGEFIYLWDEDFGDIREAIDKLEESECQTR